MKFRNLLISFTIALIGLHGWAQAEPIQEFTLKNGMKIIVKEDHRSPVVAHMIWYKAGSMDEISGVTGVAHVLEHMMFKGTKKYKPGETSKIIASLGGQENAFTSKDYTAYYQQIGNAKLERMMELEADRMVNLVLEQKSFEKEMNVVMEERRWRTEDQPAGLMSEALYATAFVANPYRWPTVGWMSDLESMKLADAKSWYQRWYAPNNATMVVVGDVDAQKVKAMAQKHFGKIAPHKIIPSRPQTEPEQRGVRRVTVKAPAENPAVILAFKAPTLRDVEKDDDVYALDVLAAVLDGYDNARLSAQLIRKDRVAHDVDASYSAIARGPSLFTLEGTPATGTSTEELEKRLRQEIGKIAAEGVSEAELKRVKAQLISSQIYKRDSLFGQALEIGAMEMSGIGYKQIDRIIEKLKMVTPQQVQDVAKKYFGDDTLTVVTLVPLPLENKKVPPANLRH